MRSHYSKCNSFIALKRNYFSARFPGKSLNIPWNRAPAFADVRQQPFPLRCRGIGDLPSVASEAETNGNPMGQGQDCRVGWSQKFPARLIQTLQARNPY